MIKFLLLILSLSQNTFASGNCMGCNEGIRVCFDDITKPDTTSHIEVCPDVTCSGCLSVGFRNRRFSYEISDNNGFIWFGGDGLYLNRSSCERDRREDIRCD